MCQILHQNLCKIYIKFVLCQIYIKFMPKFAKMYVKIYVKFIYNLSKFMLNLYKIYVKINVKMQSIGWALCECVCGCVWWAHHW